MNKPYYLTAQISFNGSVQKTTDLVFAQSKKEAQQKYKDYLLATLPEWKKVTEIHEHKRSH